MEGLQIKPQRKAVEAEAKASEQRAFDRAFKNARKEVAKAEGMAAGIAAANGVDAPASAVEAARARALGGAKVATAAPLEKATPAPNGRTVRLQTGEEVPEEFYGLTPEEQQRMLALIKQREAKKADDNLALQSVNQVMDIQDRDRAEIKALKGQVATLFGVVEAMQRRWDEKQATVEVAKSAALVEAESQAAQTVVNMAATTSDGNGLIQRINQAKDGFSRWTEGWIAKFQPQFSEMEGRLKSFWGADSRKVQRCCGPGGCD